MLERDCAQIYYKKKIAKKTAESIKKRHGR